MKDIAKLGFALLFYTFIAGLGLGAVYQQTKPQIDAQDAKKISEGLESVLPGYKIDPEDKKDISGTDYWPGYKDDKIAGYAFIAKKNGYSSEVQVMVGIDLDGTILGAKVLSQNETPGLGTRITEVVSQRYIWNPNASIQGEATTPWFTEQFRDLTISKTVGLEKMQEWHALPDDTKKKLIDSNSITALTGATISSKAVVDGINEAAKTILEIAGKGEQK